MAVLRSTRVVLPDGVRPAAVRVEGGKIVAIESPPRSATLHDFGDLVLMPGLVDSHVHVNEPGRTEWEGFETATRAGAAGGVTTIVDMPLNSIPPTTTVANLEEKARALQGKCYVDVALWGGAIPGNSKDLRPMIAAGARGFKCFMINSGVDEFPAVTERDLFEAANMLSGSGAALLAHAELEGPIIAAGAAIAGADAHDYRTYLHSRPAQAEDQAIELLVRVCRETRAQIHIVHLASASAIDIVARARAQGLPISAETTPHYLHFDAATIPPRRTEFKCAPPIRGSENREGLWRGLGAGSIQLVVSDHSPCTPELKNSDFMKAWGGISSLQFVLPIVWTGARGRGHSISDLARWVCASPARLARLPKKGAIAVGNDADFVVWAPEESFTVEESIIAHRHKVTPYLGAELFGVVKETWLRGERVGETRRGEWLR
jgi:allantoinase